MCYDICIKSNDHITDICKVPPMYYIRWNKGGNSFVGFITRVNFVAKIFDSFITSVAYILEITSALIGSLQYIKISIAEK